MIVGAVPMMFRLRTQLRAGHACRALVALAAMLALVGEPRARSRAQAQPTSSAIATSSFDDGRGSARWGRAEGLVRAPFARIVSVLEDYGRYASLFPHFRTSRVLARRGSTATVYGEATCVGTDYWFELRMTASTDSSGARIVEARMTRGNATRFIARWRVRSVNGGTAARVRLEVVTDTNLPVPQVLMTQHNVAAARMGIEALRERAAAR